MKRLGNNNNYQLDPITEEQFNSVFKLVQSNNKKIKLKRESSGDPTPDPSSSSCYQEIPIKEEIPIEQSNKQLDTPLLLLAEPKFTSQSGEYSILHDPLHKNFISPSHPTNNSKRHSPYSVLHSWVGHTQGIFSIRLFPNSYHLLLTSGLDCKIKLWDLYGERKCLRTYFGHGKAVRDVEFSSSGQFFLSASLDKSVKLWNTESGECLNKWILDSMAFLVRFVTDQEFLVATGDNCIYLYSSQLNNAMKSEEPIRYFKGHTKPINCITLLSTAHFITTSDDKTCRIWDLQNGKTIRFISNSSSVGSLSHCLLHPSFPTNGQIAIQSSKNKILTYKTDGITNNFHLSLSNKSFFGYRLNGYACGIAFSPHGTFIATGDGDGNLVIWEWEKALFKQKINLHDKPIMSIIWHPTDNCIITASLDSTVKLISL